MEIQKREGVQRVMPNHTLDTIGNPSEACLPPSRPSLTSYALELDDFREAGADIYRTEHPT